MKTLRAAAAFALFLLLAVARTFPLVLHLRDATQEDALDSLLVAWMLAWNHHCFETGFSGYFDANIFYPHSNAFLFSELMIGPALLTAPLHWLGCSPLFCLNLLVLFSVALNGYAVYCLAKEIGCGAKASFVGGAAFCATTYTQVVLRRPHFLFVFAFLFALLFLYRFLEKKRIAWLFAYMLCAVFLLTCNMYLAVALVPASALLLLFDLKSLRSLKAAASMLAAVCGLAFAYGAYYSMYYHAIVDAGFLGPPDKTQLSIATITIANLAWPSTFNSFYSSWMPVANLTFAELHFFPGFTALLLAAIGAASIFSVKQKIRQPQLSDWFVSFVIVVLACAVVALSFHRSNTLLYHQFNAMLLGVAAGSLLLPSYRAKFFHGLKTAHPLLKSLAFFAFLLLIYSSREFSALLFDWAPQLAFIRIPGRYGLFALLAVSLLAAIALQRMFAVLSSNVLKGAIAAGVVVLLFVETSAPKPLRPVGADESGVYAWLKQQDSITVIAETPMQTHLQNATAQYRSTLHWKKLVNGYSGYFPYEFATLRDQMKSFPSRESLQALRERDCEWVLVHKDEMEPQRFSRVQFWANAAPWIEIAYEDETSLALQLHPVGVTRAVRIQLSENDRTARWELHSGAYKITLDPNGKGMIEVNETPPGKYSLYQINNAAPVLRIKFIVSEKSAEEIHFLLHGNESLLLDDLD